MQVFPNPFANSFNVYLRNFTQPGGILKSLQYTGPGAVSKKYYSQRLFFYGSKHTGFFRRGMYILKIQSGNEVKFVKKILKQ